MGGFFGTISTRSCVNDLFYGTDYNSHLGTKRAGLVTFDKEQGFSRKIHNLERDYFRTSLIPSPEIWVSVLSAIQTRSQSSLILT